MTGSEQRPGSTTLREKNPKDPFVSLSLPYQLPSTMAVGIGAKTDIKTETWAGKATTNLRKIRMCFS